MANFLISPHFIFGVFIVIFAGHIAGLDLGWYEVIGKLDDIHHFLGGIWFAAVIFYFLKSRPQFFDAAKNNFWISLMFAVGLVAIIGTFWEFFEFFVGKLPITFKEADPYADTLGDLAADLSGGLLFSWVYLRNLRRRTRS